MISGDLIHQFKEKFFIVFPEMREIKKEKLKQFLEDGIPFGLDRPYLHLHGLLDLYDMHTLAFGEPVGGYHPLQCLECAAEHIAKAMVNLDEVLKGYDGTIENKIDHLPLLIGNIAEAEAQTAQIHDDLSQRARAIKLRIRGMNIQALRGAKADLSKLYFQITATHRGVSTKRTERVNNDPKGDCGGCGKNKK